MWATVFRAENCSNGFSSGCSTRIKRNCLWNKKTEQINVSRAGSTNKMKSFEVDLLLNEKLVTGFSDTGSRFLLISFDTYERLGKPRSIKVFNNKVLAVLTKELAVWTSKSKLNQNSESLPNRFDNG